MDIAEAIRLFVDSKIESDRQLEKVGEAKLRTALLEQLRLKADDVATKIRCELAVIEAQYIISSDALL